MFNAFVVLNFELAWGSNWADWLLTHGDMDESYATYRRFLEICQGRLLVNNWSWNVLSIFGSYHNLFLLSRRWNRLDSRQ